MSDIGHCETDDDETGDKHDGNGYNVVVTQQQQDDMMANLNGLLEECKGVTFLYILSIMCHIILYNIQKINNLHWTSM